MGKAHQRDRSAGSQNALLTRAARDKVPIAIEFSYVSAGSVILRCQNISCSMSAVARAACGYILA